MRGWLLRRALTRAAFDEPRALERGPAMARLGLTSRCGAAGRALGRVSCAYYSFTYKTIVLSQFLDIYMDQSRAGMWVPSVARQAAHTRRASCGRSAAVWDGVL